MSVPIGPGANTPIGDAVGVYREMKLVAKMQVGLFCSWNGADHPSTGLKQ